MMMMMMMVIVILTLQVGLDGCIGPNNIRDVLQALRGPAPVDSQEVEECMLVLCEGKW